MSSLVMFSRSKSERRLIVTKAIVILAAVLVIIGCVAIVAQRDHIARTTILEIGDNAKLGEPVRKVLAEFGTSGLVLRKWDRDGIEFFVLQTPTRFGATNWHLVIAVSAERQLIVGVGYRTADSLHVRPDDAPKDRVSESFKSAWKRHI